MVERARVAAVVSATLLIATAGCGTGAESGGGGAAGSPTAELDAPDAAALQIRPVEAITTPGLDENQHEPTCGAGTGSPCTDEQLLDPDGITLEDAEGNRYVLGPLVADGSDVASATSVDLGDGAWGVQVALGAEGATAFASATANAVTMTTPANQIAIVADASVVSAPVVQERIGSGQVQISGGFSQQEAEDLAAALGGS